ncbi:hypothetical protein [Terrabacter terrigena]|uniref:Uncharacterized protein n=1 Tax=Terrabacter terrigena TaxID=574718 RepID=A0ABW3N115_9MICO
MTRVDYPETALAFDALLDALDGADAGTKDEAFAVLAGGAA